MQDARSQIGEIWWPTNHSSYQPTLLAALPLVAGLAKKPKVVKPPPRRTDQACPPMPQATPWHSGSLLVGARTAPDMDGLNMVYFRNSANIN